jgi:hypothetical protein
MSRQDGAATLTAARLGLFGMLFQAVLFGWHHHDLILAGRLTAPVIANPTAPPQAVDDEDGCEICQVLQHLTAAPPEIAGALPRLEATTASAVADGAFAIRGAVADVRARAPPSPDAANG